MEESGKTVEQRRIQFLFVQDDYLTPKSIDRQPRRDEDIHRSGIAFPRAFDEIQSGDNAPSVMADVMSPAHVAMIILLRLEIRGAEKLGFEVVRTFDNVASHKTPFNVRLPLNDRVPWTA
jgi:hypothetical protein